MRKFQHPLMSNNFDQSDFNPVIKLLKKKNAILTQSINVRHFEKMWSKWLGVKYSVFVNSGSSANLISLDILRHLKGKGEVIVPALTWSSDISSVIKNHMKPIFVDIDMNSLSMNDDEIIKKFTKKTKGIFLTHAQGFNGLTDKLLNFIKKKKIFLIEDVCESHGAKFKNKKLGNFGDISNFSFYYAHHMSTIEGGMICTNNRKIYELARILRSHGLVREMSDNSQKQKLIKKFKNLSPNFIFLLPAYNMRNNEIGGLLGLSQLKKLDKNNEIRKNNFKLFIKNLDAKKFFIDFKMEGSCNYAFPIILKTKNIKTRDKFEALMKKNSIEFRRGNAGGGNMLRQPFLKNYVKKKEFLKFKNTEHIHNFGYYIGNFPKLNNTRILKTCKVLNSINL